MLKDIFNSKKIQVVFHVYRVIDINCYSLPNDKPRKCPLVYFAINLL